MKLYYRNYIDNSNLCYKKLCQVTTNRLIYIDFQNYLIFTLNLNKRRLLLEPHEDSE